MFSGLSAVTGHTLDQTRRGLGSLQALLSLARKGSLDMTEEP